MSTGEPLHHSRTRHIAEGLASPPDYQSRLHLAYGAPISRDDYRFSMMPL